MTACRKVLCPPRYTCSMILFKKKTNCSRYTGNVKKKKQLRFWPWVPQPSHTVLLWTGWAVQSQVGLETRPCPRLQILTAGCNLAPELPGSKTTIREESRKGKKGQIPHFSTCSASWTGLSWTPTQEWSGERQTKEQGWEDLPGTATAIKLPTIKTTSQSQERLSWGATFSSQSRSEMGPRRGQNPPRGPCKTEPSWHGANGSPLLESAPPRSQYGPIGFSPSTLCWSILTSNRQKTNSIPTPGMRWGWIEACKHHQTNSGMG